MTKETGHCVICGNCYEHFGNNPEPIVSSENRVCDHCNSMFVIPNRMGAGFTHDRAVEIARALRGLDVYKLAGMWSMFLGLLPENWSEEKKAAIERLMEK